MLEKAEPWIAAPFIRIVLPFCVGVLGSELNTDISIHLLIGINVILYAGLLLVHLTSRARPLPIALFGTCLYAALACLGLTLAKLNDQRIKADWFGHQLPAAVAVIAEPEALPALGAKSARYIMQVNTLLRRDGSISIVKGRFLLYLSLKETQSLQPGRFYWIRVGNFKPLISSGNPGSFDFARYNARKNIFHQTYQSVETITAFSASYDNKWRRWLTRAQQSALEAMDRTIPAPHHQLAKALLIGYREEVDKELLTAYADTGVVHVIAVSGMHLGLIFFLLQRILVFPETRFPHTKWIKFLLVIAITWFFSAVAGSAGSIIRAAAMFSFLLFSKLLHQPASPLQSISLTAFMLLLWDPFWLWDAGFLLSFGALLSIVLFQRRIQLLLTAKHPLLQWVSELIAVTLAAQILTTPLSIAFFHQAPVYFLPANLLAVPLSSLALISTLVIWISFALGMDFTLAGKATYLLIEWMNRGIAHISRLPAAVLKDFNWNWAQVAIAYLIVFLISRCLQKKELNTILITLSFCLLWLGLDTHKKRAHQEQQYLLVYHIPGKSVIAFIEGKSGTYFLNQHTPADHPAMEAGRRHLSVVNWRYMDHPVVTINEQLIAIPQNNRMLKAMLPIQASVLILHRNITNIQPLLAESNHPALVIIDGSVPEFRAIRWAEQLHQAGIFTHSTWEKGAFQQRISREKPVKTPEK